VEEPNAGVGRATGVTLLRYTWDSYLLPVETGGVQDTVSETFGHVDVFLLILDARLGTPIGVGRGSGTEEEFRIAVEKSRHTGRPHILMLLEDRTCSGDLS
jgi:hypothetical protein